MIPTTRPSRRLTPLWLLAAALVATTVAVPSGASPSPGPDNPWLERRIAGIAHAGGEDENPQETLYAYARAAEAGIPVLDLDLQLSADGVPVVIHDNTVDRTTGGTGPVHSYTAAELGELDAAHWYSEGCATCHDLDESAYLYRGIRTGEVTPPPGFVAADFGVPTLEDVFTRFPDSHYSLEIKDDSADEVALAQATAELIERFGLTDKTTVASFGDAGIDAFRAAAPEVATSATLLEVQDFFLGNTVPVDAQILHVPPVYDLDGTPIQIVSPDFVARAHDAGLAVWVWMDSKSQQNAEFYDELIEMGVDGLNVSRPAVLMELLAERGDGWDPNRPPASSTTTSIPDEATEGAEAARPVVASPDYTG